MRLEVHCMRLDAGACQDMRLDAGACQDMRLDAVACQDMHELRDPLLIFGR